MAEDIQKLIISVGQRGLADVERSFKNLDGVVSTAFDKLGKYNKNLGDDSADAAKRLQAVSGALTSIERNIQSAGKGLSTTFDGKKIQNFDTRVRKLQRSLLDAVDDFRTAEDQATKASAKKRIQSIQSVIDKEVASFGKLYAKHREQFQELAEMQRKTGMQNFASGARGTAQLINQLRSGDVGGAANTLGSGGKQLFQGAQKRSFDSAMKGSKGAAGVTRALGALAKVAGPMAAVAMVLGSVVKAFLDLDARVKDINKSMLKNVPLTSLAADQFGDLAGQVADGEQALREIRNTILTDADLRMLGMTPEMMSQTMLAIEQQAGGLSNLRSQGVSARDALEAAQVAALNLGVDANETMGLIGSLIDVTGASFNEAVDSLSMVISSAQDAGVSTQKFFNIVQSVVGEMGMYNYRLEETAALFSKLTNVMDSKSAEDYLRNVESAFKGMSATDRMGRGLVLGARERGAMGARARESAVAKVDAKELAAQMKAAGLGSKFIADDIGKTLRNLSTGELAMITSAMDRDQKTRVRTAARVERNTRGGMMRQQGSMQDYTLGDRLMAPVLDLERLFKKDILDLTSVESGTRGIDETQLRQMQDFVMEMRGDFARLERGAKTMGPEQFAKFAKDIGYEVSVNQEGQIVGRNGKVVQGFRDLFTSMGTEKSAELQKEQKTLAQKQSDMQRTMLDTIRFKLLGLVEGIYRSILDIYDTMQRIPGLGKDERAQATGASARKEFELHGQRSKLADKLVGASPEERKNLEAQIAAIDSQIAEERGFRDVVAKGNTSTRTARSMARTGKATENELRDYEARGRAVGSMVGADVGAKFYYDSGMESDKFQGRQGDLGTLTKILTGSGKLLTKQEEIDKYLEKQGALGEGYDVVGKVIAKQLEESGELFPEDAKKISEKTNQILGEQGINLSQKAVNKLVQAQLQAQIDQQVIQDIMKMTGRDMASAQYVLGGYRRGDKAAVDQFANEETLAGIANYYGINPGNIKPMNVQSAQDARMVTGGMPLLNLKPGDIIVDQAMLAQTLVGGAGQFVPDLLRGSVARNSASSSSTNTLNANIVINGNNPGEMRTEMLRILQEWEDLSTTR